MDTSGNSSFHSLQAELRLRRSKYVQFGSSFTYGHAIDTASDFFDLAGSYALPQNSQVNAERASASYDSRLRSVTHFLTTIPKPNRWIGEWQIAGIYEAQSGQPFTINSVVDSNRDGNLTDRPDMWPVACPSNQCKPGEGLNAKGGDGIVGRNTVRAQGINNLDVVASRRQPFGERASLLFRLEVYNILNNAQYGIPARLFDAPGFLQPHSLLVPPRTTQIALKLVF